jgi:peptidoglycan/xylan/chitin deacetylase (PgdA/CDA1 family)
LLRRLRVAARRRGPLRPIRHGPRDARRVALTFDDGPGRLTTQVLDALRECGARATFNVLGERVADHPELIGRILGEGHELGNHSFRHDRLARRPLRAHRQLTATNAAIAAAAGGPPRVFRPPYGAWSRRLVLAARAAGLVTVNWDVSPRDWEMPGADAIHERVVSRARPGSIVVLHDERRAGEQTPIALRRILRDLGASGYEFVTVSDLLGL